MIARLVRFFGDPGPARLRIRLSCLLLGVVVLADLVVNREHAAFAWDHWPGWSALYGFISCVILIFASKWLGRWARLVRREDYYD